jgi:hypothetical protein
LFFVEVLFSNSPEMASPANIAADMMISRLMNERLVEAKELPVSAKSVSKARGTA